MYTTFVITVCHVDPVVTCFLDSFLQLIDIDTSVVVCSLRRKVQLWDWFEGTFFYFCLSAQISIHYNILLFKQINTNLFNMYMEAFRMRTQRYRANCPFLCSGSAKYGCRNMIEQKVWSNIILLSGEIQQARPVCLKFWCVKNLDVITSILTTRKHCTNGKPITFLVLIRELSVQGIPQPWNLERQAYPERHTWDLLTWSKAAGAVSCQNTQMLILINS